MIIRFYTAEQKRKYNTMLKAIRSAQAGTVSKREVLAYILGLPAEDLNILADVNKAVNYGYAREGRE